MPINDEPLDQLLRDVSVPHDLKASLLQIPDRDPEPTVVTPRFKSRFAIVGLLAAIAATVLVFVYLPSSPVAVNQDDNDESVEVLLARMQQNLDSIDQLCKIQDVELASRTVSRVENVVDFEESLALAMSLSWQSSLDRGAGIESVKPELQYVVNTFPGTRGASVARDILELH